MRELICINCPRGCRLKVDDNLNVTGNFCPRGAIYAKNELTHPVRTLTSTVKVQSTLERRLPVKSSEPLPKEKVFEAVRELDEVNVEAPVHIGDIVVRNIAQTGINIIATKNIEK